MSACQPANAVDTAILIQTYGAVLYNHTQGAFSVDSGNYCTQALDTKFSVQVYPNRSVKIAVWAGDKGVLINGIRDQRVQLKAGTQIHGSADGRLDPAPEPLDGDTTALWRLYGNGEALDIKGGSDPFMLAKCDPSLKNELYRDMPQEVSARLGCPQEAGHIYNSANPAAITYTNDHDGDANGTLFDDTQQRTVYAVRWNDSTKSYTWETYYSVGDAPTLRKLHPALDAALGPGNLTCPPDLWAVQRFAGGSVMRIPGNRINFNDCVSQAGTHVVVLYADGSAELH